MISSLCLSMISALVARENRFPPIGSLPEGMLFRIMLWQFRIEERLRLETSQCYRKGKRRFGQ